jgi:hypothetical protein
LVRSVRVGGRVIQQTVAHLGELDEHGRIEARVLARRLIGAPEQAQLFDDGNEHMTVPVRLKGIRIERSRRFGEKDNALRQDVDRLAQPSRDFRASKIAASASARMRPILGRRRLRVWTRLYRRVRISGDGRVLFLMSSSPDPRH